MTVMFRPKFIITLTLTTNESNTAPHTNKGGNALVVHAGWPHNYNPDLS